MSPAELTVRPRRAPGSLTVAGGLYILLILDLAYFINAMDRQLFPVLVPDIRAALDLTSGEVGLLTTIFTLGMGLAGIPAGYLTDRWGRKNVIIAGLVVFSITTALQAVAVGWFDLAVYRVLSGIGEGLQNAALYAAAGSYFHRHRGLAIGTLGAAYGLGAFTGPAVGSALVGMTGHWETPLLVFGAVGLVVLAVVFLGLPRWAADYGSRSTGVVAAAEMGVTATGRLFNRTVIWAAVTAVAAGFAIYGYLGLYPTYLRDAQGFTPTQASLAASMFGIGALAAVLGGLVADRVNQRLLNAIGLVMLMVIGSLIFGVSSPPGVQMILSVLMGAAFTGVIYTNTSALMQRSVAPALVGRVSGVFLAALYIPASISGYVFALAVSVLGWTAAGIGMIVAPGVVGLLAMAAMGAQANPRSHRPASATD
jgi:MFS family permease